MPGEAVPVTRVVVAEENQGVVIPCIEIDSPDLLRSGNDALGEQKSHDEMIIVSGGPHEDGQSTTINDHLQRFLRRELVVCVFSSPVRPTLHLAGSGRRHD